MATGSRKRAGAWTVLFNLPNQLTSLRLVLAVVLFCFIALDFYVVGIVLFLIAAGTDWLDGYYARRYGQVTTLGRILDPFADKVIICGTYIFLVATPVLNEPWYGLKPWMVVVVVGRELLVTALRSTIENQGSDFSAKWSGKLKMVFQCVAAVACLCFLAQGGDEAVGPWLRWTLGLSLWTAVALTVYSGLIYVHAAVKLLRGQ